MGSINRSVFDRIELEEVNISKKSLMGAKASSNRLTSSTVGTRFLLYPWYKVEASPMARKVPAVPWTYDPKVSRQATAGDAKE